MPVSWFDHSGDVAWNESDCSQEREANESGQECMILRLMDKTLYKVHDDFSTKSSDLRHPGGINGYLVTKELPN
jgi:hypothetical protein